MEELKSTAQSDPIQFGLVPLFFLTAFFAALVMLAIEAGRPLPGDSGFFRHPDAARRDATVLAYGGLAFVMAVATVVSMIRPRKRDEAPAGQANSLAPQDADH